jgi:hypothetical protein
MISTMRIRRGLLFWGLFLIPVGALTLLVRGGFLDADALRDAWRLWPLILVGLGLAILLGRTRGAALGTALSGLVLGLIVGGGFASGSWVGFGVCIESSSDLQVLEQSGAFEGPAAVRLDLRCGEMDVATESGVGWSLQANYAGPPPIVDATGDRLDIQVAGGDDVKRQVWTVRLAPDRVQDLDLSINAANGTVRLDGATLARLGVDANASDLLIAGGAAAITRLDASVNAGRIRITLGSGSTIGDLSLNAGEIDLCVPPDAGLRIRANDQLTFATNLGDRGLTRTGPVWSRPGTGSGGLIDLTIEGSAATFQLDPDGGCA